MNQTRFTLADTGVDFTEATLMTTAQQQTGLFDWREDGFRSGMHTLLHACQDEADLSAMGQQWLHGECLRWLTNRLQIQNALVQHPEILDVKIRNPIFVIGLPRSGTTFLHRLLSSMRGARIPLYWELWRPAPPPQAETRLHDPRIAQVQEAIRELQTLFPTVFRMHYFDPNAPEECYLLFQNSFCCFGNTFFFHIPSYQQWVCQCDLLPAYEYYKAQLQILSWRCPGEPWLLKHQDHLLSLPTLLTVFSDARIIHIHRHPRQVIASLCSVQNQVLNQWRATPMTNTQVGEYVLSRWLIPLQRAMQARATLNVSRIHDVQYSDLLADPLGTVHQIYHYLGEEADSETFQQMQHWLDDNPQDKHGRHNYTLETFGVDPNQVDETYADYIRYFQVKM